MQYYLSLNDVRYRVYNVAANNGCAAISIANDIMFGTPNLLAQLLEDLTQSQQYWLSNLHGEFVTLPGIQIATPFYPTASPFQINNIKPDTFQMDAPPSVTAYKLELYVTRRVGFIVTAADESAVITLINSLLIDMTVLPVGVTRQYPLASSVMRSLLTDVDGIEAKCHPGGQSW